MDIAKQIIDQRVRKIVSENPDWFPAGANENQRCSKAFLILSISSYLGIELEEARNMVTDGGNDAGVDAVYIGDVIDLEFPVTIFQAKYTFNLEKNANFPGSEIQKIINSVGALFDPKKPVLLNDDIKPRIEEIRSLISDGYIPTVKIVCINNGLVWGEDGKKHILNSGFKRNQVMFEHFNHDDIVSLLQNQKGIKATLHFTGKSIVEDFNYKRVLIGKVNVTELADLFGKYGDLLLEKNIRRYLGLNKNRVNESIGNTLTGAKKDNFYFYNNGITIVSTKFSYNALQGDDWKVTIDDLQIINGGQTCKTINQTLIDNPGLNYSQVFVLVRLYELSGQDVDNLVTDITIATNSQNPVDLRDLRANDEIQRKLELSFKELGYSYKRKKDSVSQGDTIPSSVVAESVYSIWRKKPHQAKFRRSELFGKFYDEIFENLNSAQAMIAVLIYRYCDSQRRRVSLYEEHLHLPYSNYFLSMIIGQLILEGLSLKVDEIDHTNFSKVQAYFDELKEKLFNKANERIESALVSLVPQGLHDLDPRSLSAIFRRGDLLQYL
ncbi:AIPR protein [Leptospira wolffii]|uniref:AIPR family protein n=1 Tax=Leptospira wolffii TaxID=409998 RepID=UPI001082D199|nr:AIPR family protein [Leptospira wolffii]TGK55227.1 AIPR protein [Leptospira wolffii]TGK65736.1 AIPR protein [Leptospira wolffii]TGK70472.1 AIPR protein [Leptospira wolffii]TGL29992.1 AIPR protein [Leptospira wolffii]